MSSNSEEKLMIIDCDAGVDDAEAIALACSSEDVKILGITCVGGNTGLDNVTGNVLRVLHVWKKDDVPVFRGAPKALLASLFSGTSDPSAAHIHGADGLGGHSQSVPVDLSKLHEENAPSALIRLIKANANKVSLVTLGPLTNIALALTLCPEIGGLLKECIIMGGTTDASGNIRALVSAEFNFSHDPEAASVVLNSLKCPITIVPFDTCRNAGLPMDWYRQMMSSNSMKADFLQRINENTIRNRNKIAKEEGIQECYYSCDLFAMVVALDGDAIKECCSSFVDVENTQSILTRGQMVCDKRGVLGKEPNAKVVTRLNQDKVKSLLMKMV